MKKTLIFILITILLTSVFIGCKNDTIELDPLGSLKIELTKSYKPKVSMNKGVFESFYAKVSIVYADETVEYNCHFIDPQNVGVYSNDPADGDRIVVKKGVDFKIIIETEIDGYVVSGESETIQYSDDDTSQFVVKIELLAGTFRVATYVPATEDIYGSYVIAYGEVVEVVEGGELHEGAMLCVAADIYETFQSDDQFTIDSPDGENFITEYYMFEQGSVQNRTKFQVMLQGLSPKTKYYLRAMAMADTTICYGRVVSFTTTENTEAPLIVNTGNAEDVTYNSAAFPGFAILNSLNVKITDVTDMGFIATDYETYRNTGSLDFENATKYGFAEQFAETFNAVITGFEESTAYVYRAYATIQNDIYYGNVKMFATTQNPANLSVETSVPANTTETGTSAILYGSIVDNAGFQIIEAGFKYSTTESIDPSVMESTSIANSTSVGQFYSQISLPVQVGYLYYAAYAKTADTVVYGSVQNFEIDPEALPDSPQLAVQTTSNITTHSLTITSSVQTNGAVTRCGVIYSEVAGLSYGDLSGDGYETAVAGSVSGNFTFTVNGLSAGSIYYMRLYADNGYEVVQGDEFQITTLTVGDTGPAGGIIFYAGEDFALEAPAFASYTLSQAVWGDAGGMAVYSESPSSIGQQEVASILSGYANTEAIVGYHTGITYSGNYAAKLCADYTLGGYSDFYLPSFSEMSELKNYYTEMTGVLYWTSDEVDATNAYLCDDRASVSTLKTELHYYYPIRRF